MFLSAFQVAYIDVGKRANIGAGRQAGRQEASQPASNIEAVIKALQLWKNNCIAIYATVFPP